MKKEICGIKEVAKYLNISESETRQLDCYKNLGVTTSKYSGAIKNGSWW